MSDAMNEKREILVEEVDSVTKPPLAKVEDAVDVPERVVAP